MSFSNLLRVAVRALGRNRLRSSLTALGIVIGVAAVIALVSIGNGAKAQIESRIAELGKNLLLISPGSFQRGGVRSGWGGRISLKPGDADAIAREVPHVVAVSPEVRSRSQVLAAGRNWNTVVLGESSDYPEIRNWPVGHGAMFTPEDVRRKAKVAVVGRTLVTELFPDGRDPLGAIVRIGNVPFRIVGVLAAKGFSIGGQDQDDVVIIPYTSHLRRISRRDYLNTILVQVSDVGWFDFVAQQISDLFYERHQLGEADQADFTIRSQLDLVERATATTKTMTLMVGAIAGVSLLVGGIGIMNIMVMSVTERTREIGVRLALGAHDRDVMRQFLCESVMLSLGGGMAGVIGGVVVSRVAGNLSGWPVEISGESIVLALGFSLLIGIFFGYYPARHASRLNPIEALRYE